MAFLWVLIILFLIFLDQITKYLVVINMEVYESIPIIKDVLHITYIHNKGAAFGSLSDSRWLFMILSTVAIVAIIVFWCVKKPKSKMLQTIMSLTVAGGIANMIDRVRLGYVIDFIDFRAFPEIWKWIFNVADSCVTIAAGMFIVWMILDTIKDEKKKKAEKAAELSDAAAEAFDETVEKPSVKEDVDHNTDDDVTDESDATDDDKHTDRGGAPNDNE